MEELEERINNKEEEESGMLLLTSKRVRIVEQKEKDIEICLKIVNALENDVGYENVFYLDENFEYVILHYNKHTIRMELTEEGLLLLSIVK